MQPRRIAPYFAAAVALCAVSPTVAQDGPSVEVFSASGGHASVPRWRLPIAVNVSLGAGYDTNASTGSTGEGSLFTSGNINVSYNFGTLRTRANLSAGTGITYYPEIGGDQYDPNVSLDLSVTHRLNLRATLNAQIGIRYTSEPDFSTDIGPDRRSGDYLSTSNSLSLSYQWLPRFSTVTGYSFAAVVYDTTAMGQPLDRLDHGFSQSVRYLYLPVTTLVADFRLGITTYQDEGHDSASPAVLVGLEHTFNKKLSGSLRVGPGFRSSDAIFDPNDGWNPHVEASLNYALTGRTSLSWNLSYSTQESYVRGGASTLSLRTGLVANYALTKRIATNISCYYQHNDNGSVELLPGFVLSFGAEDVIDLSLGMTYLINRYFSASASYSHTEVNSDLAGRSYTRDRISGSLGITF